MNIGSIPGFYFDEEKKRYFKIGESHQVPKDAKYSKSSVQQDKRESKKRKLEDRRRQHLRTQTVIRPKILSDALIFGTGLCREHGTGTSSRSLAERDTAFVKELMPSRRKLEFDMPPRTTWEVVNMEPCVRAKGNIVTLRCSRSGGGVTRTLHWVLARSIDHHDFTALKGPQDELSGPYAAFGSPVTSISTAALPNDETLILASTEQKASPGNIFSGRLIPSDLANNNSSTDDAHIIPPQLSTSNFATLGTTPSTSLWATSINPAPNASTVAVAGTLGVWTLDTACTLLDRLSITRRDYAEPEDDETRAVDWLDAHTVAAGNEHVYLWDQRSGGASQRFRCRGRVTGIQNPERGILHPEHDSNMVLGGQTLLISTNRAINLFDVRYINNRSQPVLTWRHEHEGLQVELTSNGQGLFAAADRDGYVHVYSTRTGGEVARLAKAEGWRGKGMLGDLRWVDDGGGRVGLRALQGGEVVEWRWRGDGEDG